MEIHRKSGICHILSTLFMQAKTIAIVGGGASGVATFIHLVLKLVVEPVPAPVTLVIIEPREEFGPGLAYGTGQKGHLLNTSAGLMGIFAGEPLHFVDWMQANRDLVEREYPGTEIKPEAYPPRNLYGHYLQAMFDEYVELAKQHTIDVELCNEEAVDAELSDHDGLGDSVTLTLASGRQIRADVAVLATGTPRSNNFNHLERSPNYLDSPWPEDRLTDTVTDKAATVCILGASLTALDAVITLTNNGHTGPLKMFSPDGLLPRVQSPKEVPFDRQILTMANIRKRIRETNQPLRVKDLFRLFLQEAERVMGKQDWKRFKRIDKPQLDLLKEDIDLALKGENIFENILYSTRYDSFDIWKLLPPDQKMLFLKWLKPYNDINRHAIPLRNAERLRSFMESGQLTVTAHSKEVEWHADEHVFYVTTEDGKTEKVDYVINATGPATSIEKMDVPILQQLLRRKRIVPYEPGGVRAEVDTMQLLVPDHPDAPLYGIGHVLVGELLDTNALWFLVARTDQMTNAILRRLSYERIAQPAD